MYVVCHSASDCRAGKGLSELLPHRKLTFIPESSLDCTGLLLLHCALPIAVQGATREDLLQNALIDTNYGGHTVNGECKTWLQQK